MLIAVRNRAFVMVVLVATTGCGNWVGEFLDSGNYLVDVAQDCSVGQMEDMIESGYRINEHDVNDHLPLHFAARSDCEEGVGLLLDAGADPNLHSDPWDAPAAAVAIGADAGESTVVLLLDESDPCSEFSLRGGDSFDDVVFEGRLFEWAGMKGYAMERPVCPARPGRGPMSLFGVGVLVVVVGGVTLYWAIPGWWKGRDGGSLREATKASGLTASLVQLLLPFSSVPGLGSSSLVGDLSNGAIASGILVACWGTAFAVVSRRSAQHAGVWPGVSPLAKRIFAGQLAVGVVASLVAALTAWSFGS